MDPNESASNLENVVSVLDDNGDDKSSEGTDSYSDPYGPVEALHHTVPDGRRVDTVAEDGIIVFHLEV